ncbi:hypothetical protein NP233_g2105 [Leucocoprinus birnbaumii]|uniref:Uncharacterized protein n=1 Tax=Leucocoprinus birnbaumii TaxID=56174 RepID=A0AAD5VYU4_9AGAR|nr:hypothetical protein NP233_g2105 [Leucocoprinus birnbaumii]
MEHSKTTWDDIEKLGWTKRQVFAKANQERGETMENPDSDIELNGNKISADWVSYNALLGRPILLRTMGPRQGKTITVMKTFNNLEKDEPLFSSPWSMSWTEKILVEITMTRSPSIGLKGNIEINDVASTGLGISFPVDKQGPHRREQSCSRHHWWPVRVPPRRKVTIIMTVTNRVNKESYAHDFGLLKNSSMVATQGKPFDGHQRWGLDMNWLLDSPKGKLEFDTVGKTEKIEFVKISEDPHGIITEEPLEIPPAEATETEVGQDMKGEPSAAVFVFPANGAQVYD